MDAKAEKIALFRYGLIASLVLEPLPRGELTRRAEEIESRHYDIPSSTRTAISVDTLLDWALRYRNGGFEALAPQARQDRGKSRTITPQLADLIERLKLENPHPVKCAAPSYFFGSYKKRESTKNKRFPNASRALLKRLFRL